MIVTLLPLLAACVSSARSAAGDAQAAPVPLAAPLNTVPPAGELVFLGVAGRRTKREEAVQNALEDAARRLALFRSVEAYFSLKESRGLGYLDISIVTDKRLVYDEDYRRYVKDFSFNEHTDVFEDRDMIIVRARCPGAGPQVGPLPPADGGRPWWVVSPPQRLSGYLAGVGYANPHGNVKDAVIASYEAAVFALIRNGPQFVSSNRVELNAVGEPLDYRSEHNVVRSAVLTGFYVLETWIDPVEKSVWTLAVAAGD